MIDKFNDLFDNISIEDLEQLDCPMPKVKISRKDKKKILSLTQRKVDNKVSKISFKKPVAILLASIITVVGTVSAGAAAYKYFNNQDSIENNLGKESVEKLQELNLVENQTQESEHFRITADTVINDGYTFNAIFTYEALDDFGEQYLKEHCYVNLWSDELGDGSCGVMEDALKDDRKKSGNLCFFLSDVESNKESVTFTAFIERKATEEELKKGYYNIINENLKDKNGKDIKFTFDLTPNYKAVEMVSQNNCKLLCSPIDIISSDVDISGSYNHIAIVYADGTEKKINNNRSDGEAFRINSALKYSHLNFGEIVDLEDCVAIKIYGTEYKKK